MIRDGKNRLGIITYFKIDCFDMKAGKVLEQMHNKKYYQELLLDKVEIMSLYLKSKFVL